MGSRLNCELLEFKPGTWYYLIEDSDAPKKAQDWRDHARAYGPFRNEETSIDHMYDHHGNPGMLALRPFDSQKSPWSEAINRCVRLAKLKR